MINQCKKFNWFQNIDGIPKIKSILGANFDILEVNMGYWLLRMTETLCLFGKNMKNTT